MRQGGKSSFILTGSQVYSPLQHAPVPFGEFLQVRFASFLKARDRALGEKEAKHPANVPSANCMACSLSGLQNAFDQLLASSFEMLVDALTGEYVQGLDARYHCQWVA